MQLSFKAAIITFCIGAGVGIGMLQIAMMESKWVAYFIFGALFLFAFIITRQQERFLWTTFILCFQVYVSFQVMWGYAGSGGFAFSLIFILAILLIGWYWLTGEVRRLPHFRFGGPLRLPLIILSTAAINSLIFTSEQFVGLTTIFMYVQFYLLYLLALNYVTTINQFDRIIKLFFIVLIIQSVIYYVQVYIGSSFSLVGHITEQGETPRPGGTVGTNSAIFAGFIMPILLIAIAHLISHENSTRARMYLLFTVLLGSIALILTIRRSAYAGALFGFIWIAIVGYRKKIIKPRIFFATATLVSLILLSLPVILTVVESSRTDNRLSSAYHERLGLMKIAINVIKNHPIAGVGPGAYHLEFKKYVTPELSDQWIFTVHNAYLQMTAEIGVVGGFALILFLLIGIRLCLRVSNASNPTLRATGLGLSGGIIAVSFEMYWEPFSVFFSPNALLWFLLGLMGAAETLSISVRKSDSHIDKHHEKNKHSQHQDGARDRPS